MQDPPEVELRLAFVWTCERCNLDQFERAVSVEAVDPEEIPDGVDKELVASLMADGAIVASPVYVVCKECSTRYVAVPAVVG